MVLLMYHTMASSNITTTVATIVTKMATVGAPEVAMTTAVVTAVTPGEHTGPRFCLPAPGPGRWCALGAAGDAQCRLANRHRAGARIAGGTDRLGKQ